MYLHHRLLKIYERNIDHYISPSNFMKDKMVEGGLPADKISVIYHFIDCSKLKPRYELGDYLLYFGRLDSEKGIDLLLKAFSQAKGAIQLKIVGSGPEHKRLVTLASELKLDQRLKFLGPKQGKELVKLISESYLVVVPSRWYEVFGLVGLEAAALGKAVLAADIGGIPELVNDRQTGLLYRYDSADDLAAKLQWATANPAAISNFGHEARREAEKRFRPNDHFKALSRLYRELIK